MTIKEIWMNFVKKQYTNLFSEDINKTNLEINELKEKINTLNKLSNKTTITEPDKLGTISYTELSALLSPFCSNVYISDISFGLTSKVKATEFSISTKIETSTWSDAYDCDEFSFALAGYWNTGLSSFAFGIAWTNVHAFNIMIDNDKQIWIVEPQTNKFIKIEDTKNSTLYSPLRVIMI